MNLVNRINARQSECPCALMVKHVKTHISTYIDLERDLDFEGRIRDEVRPILTLQLHAMDWPPKEVIVIDGIKHGLSVHLTFKGPSRQYYTANTEWTTAAQLGSATICNSGSLARTKSTNQIAWHIRTCCSASVKCKREHRTQSTCIQPK